jgi:hypothetical protein
MMNWKGFGRKRSWPNFKELSRNSPGRTEESHINSSQDSQSPGRDLNPGRPEYEAGVFFLDCLFQNIKLQLLSVEV